VLRSKGPKESILLKDELFSKVTEGSIDLPIKGKEETRELQNKLKKYPILHIKVKEESIGLPKIVNHHDENTIACIDKIYKESFNKFMDFHWIAKFVVLLVIKTITTMWQVRFLKAQTQCTIRYIPTTCTTTTYEDLGWTNFSNIFYLINTSVFTYEHALNKFPKLTHFLFLGLNIMFNVLRRKQSVMVDQHVVNKENVPCQVRSHMTTQRPIRTNRVGWLL
jgi:hypothetical protein